MATTPQPRAATATAPSPGWDFSIHNIPFGTVSTTSDSKPRPATALGKYAVDLSVLSSAGAFQGPQLGNGVAEKVFAELTLNAFMALGRPAWTEARKTLQSILSLDAATGEVTITLPNDPTENDVKSRALHPLETLIYHLPAHIGDYTDFYASREHATNVGVMFRGKENALMPNWLHLPVGYHGRSSSILPTATPLTRPSGQILHPTLKTPMFSPTKKLDYELEMAYLIGTPNTLGTPIPIADAADHVFGMVLMNDWSARDLQQWEYVPLGPFLGKNFATTISPWVVTLDALEHFKTPQPEQHPEVLPYLRPPTPLDAYDVELSVGLMVPNANEPTVLARSNLRHLYWTLPQMIAHHTINGCNLRTGDLLGTGTISGPDTSSMGSMLELTKNGTEPVDIGHGEKRAFVEDGDEIVISGYAERVVEGVGRVRVGFGECRGVVLRAREFKF
ncbi:uncharacterized protein EV422DRAFT_584905 [Fimicolochytrium jonesii]|uniref:uncharacterized protein n=1 Tax=Fimicolochytrium jonesii TaxID=1396493 RepID=UPI0022FF1E52|nr:uncharacterized protein EV422DRAFT_584905 [Fimicolochytrium jonesii]KAI8823341.1 hypothetical protein EV422DRAFT_584905 [Fimicolochytrium jonesii]